MSDGHAFDRYQETCSRLEFAKTNVRSKGEFLSGVGMRLSDASPTFVIDGLHESGGDFKSTHAYVREQNWITFEDFRDAVAMWDDAIGKEEEAWNALTELQKGRVNRCK